MRKITPSYILTVILTRVQFISRFIPDKTYLKIIYKGYMGHKLDLEDPKYFNEKIQWMKLYDRDPKYSRLIDKYEVKKYVADTIGEEYVIPTLGIYKRFDDIDFDALPKSFVIKCTHDSGSVVVVKDKAELDIEAARKKINRCLKRNIYYIYREYYYKNIPPRIIIEEYMENKSTDTANESLDGQLLDYKIFTFGGEPRFIEFDFNRFVSHKRNLYDLDWKLMDAAIGFPTDHSVKVRKPEKLEEMLDVARKLAKGLYFARVDLYCISGRIYFGEMTFLPDAGLPDFRPDSFGLEVGSMMRLPVR